MLGLAEINIHFKRVRPTNQWKDRFKRLGTNSHCATNTHSTAHDKRVFGGTAYLTSKAASHKVEERGEDPLGLGRWNWAVLTGKHGKKTRIITAYRPVRDGSNRTGTVYSQHQRYFIDNEEDRKPRLAFLEDLEVQITQWQEAGDIIILGADLNDNIWDSNGAQRIEHWGLVNAHKMRHPDRPKVATCNKNTRNIPIDGIWCSPGIEIEQAGMTSFKPTHIDTDHRMLWADFATNSLFGYRSPPLAPIIHAGVPLNDPEPVRIFNQRLYKARQLQNIPNQIFWLE
jgi:hypothetical protein